MFRNIHDHNNDKFHHDDLNIKSMIMINVNMIDHNYLKHYDHNYDNNKCDNDDLTHCNHDHDFGDNKFDNHDLTHNNMTHNDND